MAADQKPQTRGTVATVVATAAVTLALGVTAAALGGYLAPASDGNTAKAVEATEPTVLETRPAAEPGAPNVVLVPVAPDSQGEPAITPPVQPAPEVLLASYEPTDDDEDDDRDRGRAHREREHEDHHDDDD